MTDKDGLYPEGSELSYKAVVNRQKDVGDEIRRVAGKEVINVEDEKFLRELETEFETLDTQKRDLDRAALVARVDAATGRDIVAHKGNPTPSLDDDPVGEPRSVEDFRGKNPWDLSEVRTFNRSTEEVAGELRSRAMSAIEEMPGANDGVRETMANIIDEFDNDKGDLAKHALLTTSPAYMRAFGKAAKGLANTYTPEEAKAVERAMSLTTTAGGFLIPEQLDPVVINTTNGSLNQIRLAAKEVIATGNVYNAVSAGETSWSWATEATQVSDDASTFANPQITVHRGEGYVPISLEALQDEANVTGEVAKLMAAGKDTLESTAFATGSGSGQPFGIITALNTISASIIASVTTDTFGLPDLYALDEGLPARFRVNGSFLANRAIYNDIRQFDTAGGAGLWERLPSDVPNALLGRPAYEAEAMDGVISTTEDYILVFGDFSHYVIADRIGTTVEFVPQVFGANNRPVGQKGWFAWYRTGADAVANGAFRLLHST